MNIAAIEYFPTSKKGGSEKAFFEVLGGLKKLGHEVTVFYVKEGDYLIEYDKIGILHKKLPETGVKYFNISNWWNLIKAFKLINNHKPDIIYVNQLADTFLASNCKLARKVKIVCHIRVPKIGNSRLFNLTGKLVDQFICVNHLIKEQYSPYFKKERLMVIRDGIKIPKQGPVAIKTIKNYSATYLGRISQEKGILELLETWFILTQKYDLKIQLDITGPSDSEKEKEFKDKLQQKIEQRNLGELVNFKSPVEDPFEYFQHYDFSVFPSIIDESFGRTIPESVLAGTPVFARKVGIVDQILAPTKDLLLYEKDEDLAVKIDLFYRSKLNLNFEDLQRHILENYDIDKNIIDIDNIFKKLILFNSNK